jgi:glucose/arabinose dehydrogenase
MARLVLAALVALLLVGCSDDGPAEPDAIDRPAEVSATASPAETAAPPTSEPVSGLPRSVTFDEAFGGREFQRPTELGVYPGGRFFIADQGGLVSLMHPDGEDAGTLLDIRNRVLRGGNEEGFLSLALDPEFPARAYIYTYYSAPNPRRTVLSRFEVQDDAADPDSELVILEVAQPFSNHNGGAIRFGPDGMLYLGFGDGGGQGDPSGNGQNLGVLLGKIIRIDVRDAATGQPYAVPADNPFVGQPGARPEIWAYGLRNPWRMEFDAATGKLWAGDVGASAAEEVDIIEPGGNYGWDRLEGDQCHEPRANCDRRGTIAPVATYAHDDSVCAITGGMVYRGAAFPELVGSYLYGDFCSGEIWVISAGGGDPVTVAEADGDRRVSSFATDEAGEVYLVIHGGAVLRIADVE